MLKVIVRFSCWCLVRWKKCFSILIWLFWGVWLFFISSCKLWCVRCWLRVVRLGCFGRRLSEILSYLVL